MVTNEIFDGVDEHGEMKTRPATEAEQKALIAAVRATDPVQACMDRHPAGKQRDELAAAKQELRDARAVVTEAIDAYNLELEAWHARGYTDQARLIEARTVRMAAHARFNAAMAQVQALRPSTGTRTVIHK